MPKLWISGSVHQMPKWQRNQTYFLRRLENQTGKDNLKKCVPTHVLPATWKKSQCWSIPTISSGPSKKDILRCFQPAIFCKLMDKAYHEDCEHPNTPILLGRQSKSLCQSDLRWLSDIAKVAPPSELNKSQVQWPPANAGLPWRN